MQNVPSKPTVAVVGTLTRDTTLYADGSRSENLGGTHYSLLTLAHLFSGRARILPLANVGADAYDDVLAALDIPGIDPSLLRRVPHPNNHVYLTYKDREEREEILKGLVPPVDLEHFAAATDADWIIVNLTSGRDVELETLETLRRRGVRTLQLDVHSLTLGFAEGGRRVLEKPKSWERWVACADWVQMNETEARLLGDDEPLDDFALRLLDLGAQGVLITLGSEGCLGVWQGRARRSRRLPAAQRPQRAYPTGCGDVFGASFAYAMLVGAASEAALRFANAAAGAKACREPYGELRRLRTLLAYELETLVPQNARQRRR
jgi:sugar/nucleoside kinase (ribokinase family)